jgi:hypothetical protein
VERIAEQAGEIVVFGKLQGNGSVGLAIDELLHLGLSLARISSGVPLAMIFP